MRKLVKLILLCLIAYPIISIVSSCSEEEDCSMNARPMMQCYLYKIDGETERVVLFVTFPETATDIEVNRVNPKTPWVIRSRSLFLRI